MVGEARPRRDGRKQHDRTTTRRQRILRGLDGKQRPQRIQAEGGEHIGFRHAFQRLQRNGTDAIGQTRQRRAGSGHRTAERGGVFHIGGDCQAARDFGGKARKPRRIAGHQHGPQPARRHAPRQRRPHRAGRAQDQD